MDEIIVYDKVKWHYEGDFPSDVPKEQAYVPIGLLFGWFVDRQSD